MLFQLYSACFCYAIELFVCLISTSPQEISYDGKFWGNFLSDRMLEGADNRNIPSPKPQEPRKCCFLRLWEERTETLVV